MYFWGKVDDILVLMPVSNCKLKYLGPMYFTVYINFTMFSLKQEKANNTLLPLYIFLSATLEFDSKRLVSYELTLPPSCCASV